MKQRVLSILAIAAIWAFSPAMSRADDPKPKGGSIFDDPSPGTPTPSKPQPNPSQKEAPKKHKAESGAPVFIPNVQINHGSDAHDALKVDAVAAAAAKADAARRPARAAWVKASVDALKVELAEVQAASKDASTKGEIDKAKSIDDYGNKLNDQILELLTSEPVDNTDHAAPPPHTHAGAVVADRIIVVVDDLITDIYINGIKVPKEYCKLNGENFGAMTLTARVQVREGDCLAFHVANDEFRWGGSCGFATVGVLGENRTPGFASELASGRWCTCDATGDVARFINDPAYLGQDKAVKPAHPYGGCQSALSKNYDYTGDTLWSNTPAKSIWLKYVVPGQAAATKN
jgi:hypothetical protein